MKSKKIKVGIIGLGYFGKHYLRILHVHPNVELVAVADHSFKSKAKYSFEISPKIQIYSEGKDLINRSDLEAVIIATPAESHYNLARLALRKGLHVFVEKPMVTNIYDVKKLEKEVKKSKNVFMIGHQYIYNDYINYLKKRIDKEYFGRISHVFAENFYFGPIRKNVGCFLETATHELSILDYIFGPLGNVKITKQKMHIISRKQDDFAEVTIKLPNSISATILTSWLFPDKTRRMVFWGTKGMAIFDELAKNKLVFYQVLYPKKIKRSSYFFSEKNYKTLIPKIRDKEPLQNEINHFFSCISLGRNPITDISHGVRVSKILNSK